MRTKERRAELWKSWYERNPPTDERRKRKAERQRQWRLNNPELAKQKAKERYRKDPKAAYEKQVAWRKNHPEQWRLLARRNMLKRKYGLTLEGYEEILAKQRGECAICGSTDPKSKDGVFPVDHDHVSGKVRGLLCRSCNIGLGLFMDDPKTLAKAIDYITK